MLMDRLYQNFLESSGVSIDSRTLKPGQIFFAIPGDNFDGHKYVDKALDSGASLAVIEKPEYAQSSRTVLVDDSIKALQDLARRYRASLDMPVIGLTGSNGKTTTKELLHVALATKFKVHSTKGNLNNHLGVPLSLLAADSSSEILVIEMGANHIGEIELLSDLARPTCGLITNIGHAHIEGFGSFEGVIEAKTELYRFLSQNDGLIFYNEEDKTLADNIPTGSQTVLYDSELEFRMEGLCLEFKKGNRDFLRSALYGGYNKHNVLAAWTVASYFNCKDDEMLEALAAYTPRMNRSEIRELGSTTFIMDAYNANPTSMKESIDSFRKLDSDKEKVLVLGDMKELGLDSPLYHKRILDSLEGENWKSVVLVGEIFYKLGQGSTQFKSYRTVDELNQSGDDFEKDLKGAIVLLKASRSIGLEKIRMLSEN